jgi:hypothetical protein
MYQSRVITQDQGLALGRHGAAPKRRGAGQANSALSRVRVPDLERTILSATPHGNDKRGARARDGIANFRLTKERSLVYGGRIQQKTQTRQRNCQEVMKYNVLSRFRLPECWPKI